MAPLLLLALALLGAGCFAVAPTDGGGQTSFEPPRLARPADVALPAGYRIDVVAEGLSFPTGVAVDDRGRLHVVEAGYAYGGAFATPRLIRLEPGGGRTVVASGAAPPWNGVVHHEGAFYVAAGGVPGDGRLLRIAGDGSVTTLVSGLPSGDHHTNGPVAGPDGWLYFTQGTVTNSGIVGPDNADYGWLARRPGLHDVPCRDVVLAGVNVTTANPLTPASDDVATTGAFVPFGRATRRGEVIRGQVPCSGAVLRVRPSGGPIELVAWGFRNPFGLAVHPDGRLFATDHGYDVRGSRPVFGAPDLVVAVTRGLWHGWPDYSGSRAVTERRFEPPREGGPEERRRRPAFLLDRHPNRAPTPAALLGVHAGSSGIDISRGGAFGHAGQAFVAQFGDLAPSVGKVLAPVGFKVVRVDLDTGVVREFAVNRGQTNGPATYLRTGGLERPVAVRFDPRGEALYVVDFGVMTMNGRRPVARAGTGVVWRISRQSTAPLALLLLGLALAGCGSARRGAPFEGPVALTAQGARGEVVFMRHCHHCHPGGDAGLGFGLNNKPLPAWVIRAQVRRGLGAMPAFGEAEIDDRDLDALVAYLQALRASRAATLEHARGRMRTSSGASSSRRSPTE